MSGTHAVEGRPNRAGKRAAEGATTRPEGPCAWEAAEPEEVSQPAVSRDFSRLPVRRAPPERPRAELAVSAPDDAFEREADHVADRVLGGTGQQPAVRPGGERPAVQRATASATESRTVPAGVVRSPGRPLDADTRAFMEPRFGWDFSGVRVHADAEAAASANGVQALAYTVGNHIVFGAGRFAPATREGRRLLAHELAHVVQQTETTATPSLQRQKAPGAAKPDAEVGFVIEMTGGGFELEAELLRRGILRPGEYTSWGWASDGYFFLHSSGKGDTFTEHVVLIAQYIRNAKGDVTGYRIIPYFTRVVGTRDPSAPREPADSKKKPAAPAKRTAAPPGKTAPETPRTVDEMRAEFEALPEPIKNLLVAGQQPKPLDLAHLLRIAAKLKRLQPEDLELYKLVAKKLATDLDSFERSVDAFIKFKEQIRAQADAERKKDAGAEEPTLEAKLAKTWSRFDDAKFSGMNTAQKEDLARDIAAEQRNIQLEHMATHPGETALGMAESMVRLDKTAKAIAEDVREAADGSKGAYSRLAGAVGAYNKYVAAAASILFVALLFVPGVNLLELAVAGLAVAASAIALSAAESELRIKAAGEAQTAEDFKTQTAKSAAAQTQAVVAAAMLALALVTKIVARIPLPGRLQNVGSALKMAKTALLDKSGVGPAWQGIKTDLLARLRGAKQGLPEALADQAKGVSATAKAVEGMSGDEFVQHLADGDPKLADLGIPPEQAKATQQLAKTPEGKNIPEQLRRDSLQALRDAPVEAAKKVDQFLKNVDDSIAEVEQAKSAEQLRSAVDDASAKLGAEEQARQAVADEQAYVTKRVRGSRWTAIREQVRKKLGALQEEQARTEATIDRLEREHHELTRKVNELSKKATDRSAGSEARAEALREWKAAKEKLNKLVEEDELGGYQEERSKQKKKEEAILESLELKRPALRKSLKDAVKKAAKTNAKGEYLDANTGEAIQGEPVYGHKYGREHRRLALEASEKGMTQEQFNDWVNDHPEWFQTETKANNESHRFEKPGID
ncbi:eCIS core domain-containing protein [Amycolatopsis anabasis]|uniref:eCIS core domain-containing protein n=1 Tax=Amycolatopsis anabasis TaxID=1840409 RepID=UPI00131D36C4|nr:DUF4157 domain-containing protein [Amycolatopsis anabasis]